MMDIKRQRPKKRAIDAMKVGRRSIVQKYELRTKNLVKEHEGT